MRTSRIIAFSALIVLLLISVSLMAGETGKAIDRPHDIKFSSPIQVGTTLLPAGDYKVQHLMEGENHIMVFKSSANKEVARVNCKMVELPKKADESSRIFAEEDGRRVLRGITFRGEKYRHEF